LTIGELMGELPCAAVEIGRRTRAPFPFVLTACASAAPRRQNTIFRSPEWRKKDAAGALRMSPHDAPALGVATAAASHHHQARTAEATVEVRCMQAGHVSLPNGLGLSYPDLNGTSSCTLSRICSSDADSSMPTGSPAAVAIYPAQSGTFRG